MSEPNSRAFRPGDSLGGGPAAGHPGPCHGPGPVVCRHAVTHWRQPRYELEGGPGVGPGPGPSPGPIVSRRETKLRLPAINEKEAIYSLSARELRARDRGSAEN
jgi:hypothetical protein